MSFQTQQARYQSVLEEIRGAGMWKGEQLITTPQRPRLERAEALDTPARPALNLCANNYLGLADHPT